MEDDMKLIRTIIELQNKRKENLNDDISNYENFKKLYFHDNHKLRNSIECLNGSIIKSYFKDIKFMIDRMENILSKLNELTTEYMKKKEAIFFDAKVTENCFLFTSYAYSIIQVYKDESQKKFFIKDFESKTFDQGVKNLLIRVIRNTSIHGKLFYPSFRYIYIYISKR